MSRPLPAIAVALGVAGLIPFLATALGSVSSADALQATRLLAALVAYGAVILAFLGGPHWGFVLSEDAPSRVRYRLALGVAPALVAWVALLVLLLGRPEIGLAIVLAGVVALTAAEGTLRRAGLMPPRYLLLRWGLSIAVALLLSTVLVLRLLGARIIF